MRRSSAWSIGMLGSAAQIACTLSTGVIVGQPDNRGSPDAGMPRQHVLKQAGVDIGRGLTGDDHVFDPVDEVEESVLVPPAEIAGVEPAVLDDLRGHLWVVPVLLHHQWAAHAHLTDPSRLDLTALVPQRDLAQLADPGPRLAHRIEAAGHRIVVVE